MSSPKLTSSFIDGDRNTAPSDSATDDEQPARERARAGSPCRR